MLKRASARPVKVICVIGWRAPSLIAIFGAGEKQT
jgi:hypothetical protein